MKKSSNLPNSYGEYIKWLLDNDEDFFSYVFNRDDASIADIDIWFSSNVKWLKENQMIGVSKIANYHTGYDKISISILIGNLSNRTRQEYWYFNNGDIGYKTMREYAD